MSTLKRFAWFVLVATLGAGVAFASSTISGTATYRERIMLPPAAVFEATLEDVSRADAPAKVLGLARIESPGAPPIRFSIDYDPAAVDAKYRYVVRARITMDGKLMFITDSAYPVLGRTGATHVDVLLKRVGSGGQGATAASSPAATPKSQADPATLENTYWKLVRLRGEPVQRVEKQGEPHLILQSEQRRVVGSGGCNRLVGSYALEGERLAFSRAAGTLRACLQGMELERAFFDVLAQVERWRIGGQQLALLDAHGAAIADFESVYLK